MPLFNMLSAFIRSLFALWALFLCIADIISAVMAVIRKNCRFTLLAVFLFIPVYFMWQVIFDFSLFGKTEKAVKVTDILCGLSLTIWLVAFIVLTLATVLLLKANIQYEKNIITPNAIKLFLDKVPCGICCWCDNGKVIFSNICMDSLCNAITKEQLMNGIDFCNKVADGIFTVNDKIWHFSCRDFIMDNESLHEMTASDISAEYAKTQALEKDKEELSQLKQKLDEYYLNLDDTVRRQEILQAKVRIHDEMNKLLLSATAVNGKDTDKLNDILSLCEKNALLLCMEAEETESANILSSINELADTLKIKLIWQNELPPKLTHAQCGLFFSAAKEAVINAVKHANAKTLNISFAETEENIICSFTNSGMCKNTLFTGGLKNLSVLAGEQGVSVSVNADKNFTLSLRFPKNQPFG